MLTFLAARGKPYAGNFWRSCVSRQSGRAWSFGPQFDGSIPGEGGNPALKGAEALAVFVHQARGEGDRSLHRHLERIGLRLFSPVALVRNSGRSCATIALRVIDIWILISIPRSVRRETLDHFPWASLVDGLRHSCGRGFMERWRYRPEPSLTSATVCAAGIRSFFPR